MKQSGNFQKPSLSFACSEDWSKMSPCEKGRFCGSCQKTVVDFTQKSDAEIQEMLSQRKEKVCGRFYAHQLDQPVQNRFSFRRVFSSVLVLLGLNFWSREAHAQQKSTPVNNQSAKGETMSKSKQSQRILPEPNNIEFCKTEAAEYLKEKRRKADSIEILTGVVILPNIKNSGLTSGINSNTGIKEAKEEYYLEPNPPFVTATPEVMPVFKNGGDAGLQKFLKENKRAVNDDVEGLVVLSFIIDTLGTVQDIKVLKDLSPATTKEALRLASLLTFEPGLMHGKKVKVKYTLPIRFNKEID